MRLQRSIHEQLRLDHILLLAKYDEVCKDNVQLRKLLESNSHNNAISMRNEDYDYHDLTTENIKLKLELREMASEVSKLRRNLSSTVESKGETNITENIIYSLKNQIESSYKEIKTLEDGLNNTAKKLQSTLVIISFLLLC